MDNHNVDEDAKTIAGYGGSLFQGITTGVVDRDLSDWTIKSSSAGDVASRLIYLS